MAKSASRIQFFGNTDDDLHCFQAVLRMILKHFEPQKDYSWSELEAITGFRTGKWTWATKSLLWLKRRGYDIRSVDSFDLQRFVDVGEDYLIEFWGDEAGKAQIAMSDIGQEIQLARQYIDEVGMPEKREATLQDFLLMRRDGFLTGTNLNSRALNGLDGYFGHFVLLLDADLKHVVIHDPGLPRRPKRRVKLADFEKAWAYPDKRAKSLAAVRLGKTNGP